jgi:hypothetical protein
MRYVAWDHRFFLPVTVPNHDMYQGAPFFATSMHSMRISGDLAWWNPFHGGYAQYYQSFFSPLAPTTNHIVFIVWAQLIGLLGLAHIAIPEYEQYVAVNFLVFPFLSYVAFGTFASLIFRRRAVVVFVLVVYAFSGLGIWNSSWFYFQEPATLFFFLAAAIAVLQAPTVRRWALLAAAIVLQATSMNYWTVYDSFFIVIVLGSYAGFHREQVGAAWVALRVLLRRRRRDSVLVLTAASVVLVAWAALIGLILTEQAGHYFRSPYGLFSAYDRVHELRVSTIQLFDPNFARALQYFPSDAPAHNARYIGAFLTPLLLVLPVLRWRRRERWLLTSAFGILIVTLAPPLLLELWANIPFFDRVGHLFYFYIQFWGLLVVLLAGASLDSLLAPDLDSVVRRRVLWVLGAWAALLVLMLLGAGLLSFKFAANDANLQSLLWFTIVALIATIALVRTFLEPGPGTVRRVVGVLIVLALVDLTHYFFDANRADEKFTAGRWGITVPLTHVRQAALRRPWHVDSARSGLAPDPFGLMPIPNGFWPRNFYMVPKYRLEANPSYQLGSQRQLPHDPPGPLIVDRIPLQAFDRAQMMPDLRIPAELAAARSAASANSRLLLDSAPTSGLGRTLLSPSGATAPPGRRVTPASVEWSYNRLAFDASLPRSGWLLINQLYDGGWRVKVDGRAVKPIRANFDAMAIPTEPGRHRVTMDFDPLARRLYWWAVGLLELLLVMLAAVAAGRFPRR